MLRQVRVAQPFDGIPNTVGASSFTHFAKGGWQTDGTVRLGIRGAVPPYVTFIADGIVAKRGTACATLDSLYS